MTTVEPGQLWRDLDKRNQASRFLRVTEVTETHAVCDAWWDEAVGTASRTTRIRLNRFVRNASGYELVETAPGVAS